jgi:tetratricopeptide (TPR) repeat protein
VFTEHPSQTEIYAVARGEAGHDEARRHVEAGCVRCTSELRQAAGGQMGRFGDLLYRAVMDDDASTDERYDELAGRLRAWKALGDGESAAAEELATQLLAIPAGERRGRIRSTNRFASGALVDHLVERAREEGFREPARAVELAKLAVEVAEVLEPAGYPHRLAADAQALAWAMLANAHRIQAELVEAERAMATARRLLAEGTGLAGTRAEILSLEGSLRTDEARFGDAVAVLTEAAEIARALGDSEHEGKLLFQLGNAAGEAGNSAEAVQLLERAKELLDATGARRLGLYAAQALAYWLRTGGWIEQARALFDAITPEFLAEIEDPSSRLRFAWVGGGLAAAEGDLERGERELRAVRRAYAELDRVYPMCVVSLELAALLLEQGRTAEVRDLTREMIPVFASRQIHHHALAALAAFQEAVERDQATAALAESVMRYLSQAKNNPYLQFEGLRSPH